MRIGISLGITGRHHAQGGGGGGGNSDDFNRADNALTLGDPWVAQTETWGISGNKAYAATAAIRALVVRETGLSDGTISMILSTTAGGGGIGLWVRSTDSNNGWMLLADTAEFVLYKKEAGSFGHNGAYAVAPADGDLLSAVLAGSSIALWVNGVERVITSNAFNSTVTTHGMTAGGVGGRMDDWARVP